MAGIISLKNLSDINLYTNGHSQQPTKEVKLRVIMKILLRPQSHFAIAILLQVQLAFINIYVLVFIRYAVKL